MKKKVFIILFCLFMIGMAIVVMLFVKGEHEKFSMKETGVETILQSKLTECLHKSIVLPVIYQDVVV